MDGETGWLVAGSSLASGVLGILLTKGVEALRKLRSDALNERKYEDDRTVEGYQMTIESLQKRVDHLEALLDMQSRHHTAEMESIRKEHIDCVKNQTALSVQNEHQAKELARLDTEIQSLREWRHTVSNAAQAKAMEGN